MAEQGAVVITRWVKALEIITGRALSKLEDPAIEPKDWKDAVEAVCRIGAFIPAESVKQLQDSISAGKQPGIGTGTDGGGDDHSRNCNT